jgi:SnoaL-like domain
MREGVDLAARWFGPERTVTHVASNDDRLQHLCDEQEIHHLLLRYARGIDRRDLELVRSCYHPDATDQHGSYNGDVEGFIAHLARNRGTFERTMHFLGNQLIELKGDSAHAETYCVAFHRRAATASAPAADVYLWLRYIDRLERRDGTWKIAHRVCAFDWSRVDPVGPDDWVFAPETTRGHPSRDDVLYDTLAAFSASAV